jgi:hypothetical protein
MYVFGVGGGRRGRVWRRRRRKPKYQEKTPTYRKSLINFIT